MVPSFLRDEINYSARHIYLYLYIYYIFLPSLRGCSKSSIPALLSPLLIIISISRNWWWKDRPALPLVFMVEWRSDDVHIIWTVVISDITSWKIKHQGCPLEVMDRRKLGFWFCQDNGLVCQWYQPKPSNERLLCFQSLSFVLIAHTYYWQMLSYDCPSQQQIWQQRWMKNTNPVGTCERIPFEHGPSHNIELFLVYLWFVTLQWFGCSRTSHPIQNRESMAQTRANIITFTVLITSYYNRNYQPPVQRK